MILDVKNLCIKFDEQVVFNDASFSITKNGFYCLMGRNGCGKSTLFKAIFGLINYQSGSIKILNDSNSEQISYCLADSIVFDELTVFENLEIINDDKEKIMAIANEFGIDNILKVKAKTCSAGEKQRICIARAILEEKPIILLDEATSHLDDSNSTKILEYLKKLSKDKVIIYSTHYEYEANQYADSFIKISDYKITIEDKNISNDKNPNDLLPKEETYVNEKLLKKVTYWHGENIFGVLIALLFSITMIFVWLVTINKYTAYKQYQKMSEHPEYCQIDYINIFPELAGNDYEYSKFLSDEMIENLKSQNDKYKLSIMQYFIWANYYIEHTSINTFLIDDTLEDDYVKLDPYSYRLINENNKINDNTFNMFGLDLHIKEVIEYKKNKVKNNYWVMNLTTYRKLFLSYLLNGPSPFSTVENSTISLTYGRLPASDDELILNEETLYYYVRIPTPMGTRIEKRKKEYEEVTSYEYEVNNTKKTFKVVGFYDTVKIGDEARLWDRPILTKAGYNFLLNSELEYYYTIGKSLYINSSDLTLKDVKFLLDNNLVLNNDVTFSSYMTAKYYDSLRRINIMCLVFLLTIDVLVISYYFQLWKNNNIKKFYLLSILHADKNKKINKVFRNFKLISSSVSCFLMIAMYFLVQKISNNLLNNGAIKYVNTDNYVAFDYTNYNILIIAILLLVVMQIIIYIIQTRRYLNANN